MATAIPVNTGFDVRTSLPVDARHCLTQNEMLNMIDAKMPDVYFCACYDDGKFYLYNKTNTPNAITGKFVACNMKDSYTKQEVDALLAAMNHRTTSFPTASIDHVGELYQYIGQTTNDYIFGYYYTCKEFNTYSYTLDSAVSATSSGTYYNSDGTIEYNLPHDYVDGTDYYTRTSIGTYYKWTNANVQISYSKASEIQFDDKVAKLNANDVQTAINELDATIKTIDMVKSASSDPIYSAYYNLTINGVPIGDTIKVLQQVVVNSGEIKECTTDDVPIKGLKVGETYIDLELADGKSTHIYIKINDLTSQYITDLDDVNITNPKDEDHLVYDAATRSWVNKAFTIQPSFTFTEYATNTEITALNYYVYNNALYQALTNIPSANNTSFDSTLFKLIIGGGNGGISTTAIPIATKLQLGGIKVGDRLSIAADGTLSVTVDNSLDGTSENPISNKLATAELRKKIDMPATPGTSGQILALDSNSKPEWTNLPSGVVGAASVNNITPNITGNIDITLDDIPDGTNRVVTNHWVGTKQELLNLIASGNYDPDAQYDTIDENDLPTIQFPQIDVALNAQSNNAIANSTVTAALAGKMDVPINQGQPNQFYGIDQYGNVVWQTITIQADDTLDLNSTNAIQNKTVTKALNDKVDIPTNPGTVGQVLTLDSNGNIVWQDTGSGSGTVQSVNTVGPDASGDVSITLDDVPDGVLDPDGLIRKVYKKWEGTKADLDALGTYQDGVDYYTTDEENLIPPSCGVLIPSSSLSYSLDEVQIGTWLGVPLYRKVINVGTLSFGSNGNNSSKSISYSIGNIKNVIFAKVLSIPDGGNTIDLSNYSDGTFYLRLTHSNKSNIHFLYTSNTGVTFNNVYAILEYTKSV